MKKEKRVSNGKLGRYRFDLRIPELALGGKHPELRKAQFLLARLGYLTEAYEPERLDEPTHKALKSYQAFQGLDPTGTVDPETVKNLKARRCGNEDLPRIKDMTTADLAFDVVAPDLKRGCSYHDATLTYTIETGSVNGLSFANAKGAIDRAFKTWDNAISIAIKPAAAGVAATFKIKWAIAAHGDGPTKAFDGQGNLYAHAFYPPDCNEPFPGECHFDNAETWGLGDDSDTETLDLETVALHEIGHLLGLTHSTKGTSVMVPKYPGQRRELSDDARVAIQSIYGMP